MCCRQLRVVQAREGKDPQAIAPDIKGEEVPPVFDAGQVIRVRLAAPEEGGAQVSIFKLEIEALMQALDEDREHLEVRVFGRVRLKRKRFVEAA
jgi:hypothetical protein